jgi:hypothetical protein
LKITSLFWVGLKMPPVGIGGGGHPAAVTHSRAGLCTLGPPDEWVIVIAIA